MRFAAKTLLILIAGCSGCAGVGIAVKAGTAAVSGVSAYYSYQVSKQEPVQVTTLAPECIWFKYVQIPCAERGGLSVETKRAIGENNRLAVELCKVGKPELVCP